MEISAKNSFFSLFFSFSFFKWPSYKSWKMAGDNENADSSIAAVTGALL